MCYHHFLPYSVIIFHPGFGCYNFAIASFHLIFIRATLEPYPAWLAFKRHRFFVPKLAFTMSYRSIHLSDGQIYNHKYGWNLKNLHFYEYRSSTIYSALGCRSVCQDEMWQPLVLELMEFMQRLLYKHLANHLTINIRTFHYRIDRNQNLLLWW